MHEKLLPVIVYLTIIASFYIQITDIYVNTRSTVHVWVYCFPWKLNLFSISSHDVLNMFNMKEFHLV